MTAIQGINWPDVIKMRNAGLTVETIQWPPTNMHKLVSEGIVDYYPRSVLEVFHELQSINNPQRAIEKNLMLVYDIEDYFFVAKENKKLADRVTLGLQRIIQNGRFDNYMKQFPGHT